MNAVFADGRASAGASEVSSALRNVFGADHGGYVHDHVAPALIARGLISRSDRKWLGLIPYIHYEVSAGGRRRAQYIGALLDELAQMKSLVRSDPHRARRLLEAAGVLVILSPQARAQAKKLKSLVQERSDGATVTYGGEGSGEWQIGSMSAIWAVRPTASTFSTGSAARPILRGATGAATAAVMVVMAEAAATDAGLHRFAHPLEPARHVRRANPDRARRP
jgi:hypothetical protein